ncbi:uncharacterized protein LOC144916167 isoform X1 [Branchiostoma floridae x Branchiostoma belcheri]
MAASTSTGRTSKESWGVSLRPVPPISHAFIEKWARKDQKVPQKLLKKGYAFFSGSYIHNVEVKPGSPVVMVRAKCFPSMRKHDEPKRLEMTISSDLEVDCACSCTAGKGTCNHSVALLYQLAHFQNLGLERVPPIASKTSAPQQWHIPPRTRGVKPAAISKMRLVKTDVPKLCEQPPKKRRTVTGITSTEYNPVRGSLVEASQNFASSLAHQMSPQHEQPQILQLLPQNWPGIVKSKVGDVPAGSTLSHQQAQSQTNDAVITIGNAPDRPKCPCPPLVQEYDTMSLSEDLQSAYRSVMCSTAESDDYEASTRAQSECPEWTKLRSVRLTASKFKDVCSRQKDFESLAQRFQRKTVRTSAMERGLQLEPTAANVYAQHKGVNVYPIGFVINPSAPHLGCSPDRLVYDPTAPDDQKWGLLEIKCPDKDSYQDCQYLKKSVNDGQYHLKTVHQYYFQVLGQLGITGFKWCDFMVYCKDDFIVNRITFDQSFFDDMKKKLDLFYFEHLLPCLGK